MLERGEHAADTMSVEARRGLSDNIDLWSILGACATKIIYMLFICWFCGWLKP